MLGLWHWFLSLFAARLVLVTVIAVCVIMFLYWLFSEYELAWLIQDLWSRYEGTWGEKKEARTKILRSIHWNRRKTSWERNYDKEFRQEKRLTDAAWTDLIVAFFGSAVRAAILAIPLTLVAAFIVGFISLASTHDVTTRWESRTDIVALNDNLTTGGEFYLGYGELKQQMTYVYAVRTPDGVRPVTLTTDNGSYKEVDGLKSAYVMASGPEVRTLSSGHVWLYNIDFGVPMRQPADKYIFFVPKGTVHYGVNLDFH